MFAKYKILIILGIIILLLMGSISGLVWRLAVVKDERNRHEQNYKTSQSQIKRFKDKSGADAVRVQEIQLTLTELKHTSDSTITRLYYQSKLLGNKNRELQQLLSVKTVTKYDSIFIPINDTILIRGGDTVTRVSDFKSKWLDASIAVRENELEILNYESRDEIIISLGWHKDSKFFLKRWFENKKYDADIKSLNPNSKITNSSNIRITGKRGR